MNGIRRTSLRASHTAIKRRLRTFLFAVLVSALAGGGLQPAWAQSGTVLAFPGGPFGIGNNGFVALPFIERPDAHFTVTAWVQPEDLSVFNVIFSWGGEDTGAAPFTSLGIDTAGNVQFGERKNVNVAGAQSVIGTTVLEACAWT